MTDKYSGHTSGLWKPMRNYMAVYSDQMKVCDIRGWGHLTGKGIGALGLSDDEAIAVQTANARLIADAPNLLEENKRLSKQLKIKEKIIEGYKSRLDVFCPDCRDKWKHEGCPRCEKQSVDNENKRLREALNGACVDLEAYVGNEYPEDIRHYPVIERRYKRDMSVIAEYREALKESEDEN